MKRLVGALSSTVVVSLAASASGQTFAEFFIDAINLTDADRGTDRPLPGDVIRMSVRANHDGLSFAGGRIEVIYQGVGDQNIAITEDAFAFPFDPWEVGREPLFRIVDSDGPPDAAQPRNEDVVGVDGKITDVNDDFFDFASTPPGLGGLAAAFPLESGEAIFVFDYVYRGGVDYWDMQTETTALLWRTQNDTEPTKVDARVGDSFWPPIGWPCIADVDGDQDVDSDDFFAYLDSFAARELYICDIDMDGDCDVDDFFIFLDLFAEGC